MLCLPSSNILAQTRRPLPKSQRHGLSSLQRRPRLGTKRCSSSSVLPFRAVVSAAPDASMMSDDKKLFACAAVSLFQLTYWLPSSDYKKSIENSVIIFNVRLHS